MYKIFTTSLFFFLYLVLINPSNLSAQTWTGEGDGNSWTDANNWSTTTVPTKGSNVVIDKSATISGEAPNAISRITILNDSTNVILDVDLIIQDTFHAITVDGGTLTLGNGTTERTITIAPSDNRNGIFTRGNKVIQVIINSGMTVNLTSGIIGIFNNADMGTITNNGNLIISGVTIGMRIPMGRLINNATLTIDAITSNLQLSGGKIENTGTFSFNKSTAITNGGEFLNTATGVMNSNGVTEGTSRAISLGAMSLLTNQGKIILEGGNINGRLFNGGTVVNDLGGLLDLGNASTIVTSTGTFINNGLLKNSRAVFIVATQEMATFINNGFYLAERANNLANGPGNITDNGLNIKDPLIDAMGSCDVKLSGAAYEWFDDSVSLGTTSEEGILSLPETIEPTFFIKTNYPNLSEVVLRLRNICRVTVAGPVFNTYNWSGQGDGVTWADTSNWEEKAIPTFPARVLIQGNTTLIGGAPEKIGGLLIENGSKIVLDMDLTIEGNEFNGLVLRDDVAFTIGENVTSNVTLTLNQSVEANKSCVSISGNEESTIFTVNDNAKLVINSGVVGILTNGLLAKAINKGSIEIGEDLNVGIRATKGVVMNDGMISINGINGIGVQLNGGDFVNNTSGRLDISTIQSSAISIFEGRMLTNHGVITSTAGALDDRLVLITVGGGQNNPGTLINTATGTFQSIGADSTSQKNITVSAGSTLQNTGKIILTKGSLTQRLLSSGTITNDLGGVMDFEEGKALIRAGTFTNNGLIISSRIGAGVSSSANGSVINNGFFDYANSNNFVTGQGTNVDNGINLNDATQTTIDADGTCIVDIAEAPYEWFEGAQLVGLADTTGNLTLTEMSVTTDPVTLLNAIEGVAITITNLCPAATGTTTSIFSPTLETIALKVYPTLVRAEQILTIDLSGIEKEAVNFSLVNQQGQIVQLETLLGGVSHGLTIPSLPKGNYWIVGKQQDYQLVGKFSVVK